jgi:asparagine synthase (glutamine-hydrolysing)
MGSIAAHFARSGTIDPSVVTRMIAAAPHRGSDSQSLVHGRCAFAISFGTDEDASLALVDGIAAALAGRIDNLAELASEVDANGGMPVPATPAAVLAAVFHLHGEQTPRRLRGVFAAALTDGKRLVCFRDHLGLGSLCYRSDGHHVYAATEAKQIVAGSGISREPNLDVVERIYFGSNDDTTPSALLGVERVPRATVLTTEDAAVHMHRYWDPESFLETARLSYDDVKARFDELMAQAVDRCVTGADEIISLSGGIDSPAIAAFAAPRHLQVTGRPLPALSATFPDHPSVDERPYIEAAASAFGIDLHTFAQKVNPLDRLAEWAELVDGPTSTISLPHYADYYRRVRVLGGRIVLTGELAEHVADMSAYLPHHLLTHGRFSALQGHLRGSRSRKLMTIGRLFASALEPRALTAARWRRRRNGIPSWVDPQRANEAAVRSAVRARERWRAVQLGPFVGTGQTSEAEEACQAVCGIRARRPWADIDLWELFLSLPAEMKLPDGRSKTLVKRLLRGRVPDEILDRRDKTVFDASIIANFDYPALRRWLRDPEYQIGGVDYRALRERLERQNLDLLDFMWAKNLASAHAFLSLW